MSTSMREIKLYLRKNPQFAPTYRLVVLKDARYPDYIAINSFSRDGSRAALRFVNATPVLVAGVDKLSQLWVNEFGGL
jgi:hypothetical protein